MLYSVIIAVTVIGLGQGSVYDWHDKPYGNYDFNTRAEFRQNVTLSCNDSYIFKYWIRPDLVIMRDGISEFFETQVDGQAGWVVEGTDMHIINVHGNHFGFYYCVVELTSTDDMVIKKGINYQGPYFGDLWPQYEMNVIVGCSAAGGLIVIFVLIYLIDMFYYDPSKEDRSNSGSFDLSIPGSSSMSDPGSLEIKKSEYTGIDDIEPGMDNAIQQIFRHQQSSF